MMSFQSRNRVSSNFNPLPMGQTSILDDCFNLVIEYLLISTADFARRGIDNSTFGFNLVIEYLLISTQYRYVAGCHGFSRFNLVIEYLLISTMSAISSPTLQSSCFNLVIEYLLISTCAPSFNRPHGQDKNVSIS